MKVARLTRSARYAALFALCVMPLPAIARDSLGVFEGWGAFRDAAGPRCYAIAEPDESLKSPAPSGWRAFASIGTWPKLGLRGQMHIRLSYARKPGSGVTLQIGDRKFALVAGNADAWAKDKQMDAAIIGALRGAKLMTVTATGSRGGGFTDSYDLAGVATAMDAAALGCAALR